MVSFLSLVAYKKNLAAYFVGLQWRLFGTFVKYRLGGFFRIKIRTASVPTVHPYIHFLHGEEDFGGAQLTPTVAEWVG